MSPEAFEELLFCHTAIVIESIGNSLPIGSDSLGNQNFVRYLGMIMNHRVIGIVAFLTGIVASGDTQVFFSPRGGCEKKVVELTNGAKEKIDAAVYSLNNVAIVDALKVAYKRGVKVRILVDKIQSFGNKEATMDLKQAGVDIRIHSVGRIMHNKSALFDGKAVITGSFNWTNSAEQANEENCLSIDDPKVVASFQDRFVNHLWVVNTVEKSNENFRKLEQKAAKARGVAGE